MPRHRTIVCRYCGFLQLKRDTYCDQCGKLTAQATRKMAASIIGAGITIAVGLIGWAYVRAAIKNMSIFAN